MRGNSGLAGQRVDTGSLQPYGIDMMQQPPSVSVGASRRHAAAAFVSIRWSHPQDAPDFTGKPWHANPTAHSLMHNMFTPQQSCLRLLPLLHRRGITDAAARRQQASARSQVEWHAPSDLAVGAGRFSRVLRVDAARRWVAHIYRFLGCLLRCAAAGIRTGGRWQACC